MDKLSAYRQQVKDAIGRYIALFDQQPEPDCETLFVCDEARDHYIWLNVGWSPQGRALEIIVYVRLRDGKCWIEEDWTEEGIATELVKAGVPKADIVLAFHPPEMRKYTEFAVA